MKMIIKGRHMAVTQPIHDYAEDKIGKITKFLDGDHVTTEIELWVEKNPSIESNQIVEVTVWTKGPVIRAKEASTDMYAAIDMVSEKLDRQLRKYKGKLIDRGHGRRAHMPDTTPIEDLIPLNQDDHLVKTKAVDYKPMNTEEAILQLELLGHDFFVFTHEESRAVNVLYRRDDGDFGLIEPSA